MVHTTLWKKMRYGTGEEDIECHLAVLLLSVLASKKAKGIELTIQSFLVLFYL